MSATRLSPSRVHFGWASFWMQIVLLALSAPISAQAPQPSIVFDLTNGDVANRVYPLPAPAQTLVDALSADIIGEAQYAAIVTQLQKSASASRWITSKGNQVILYALYRDGLQQEPTFDIKEEIRSTQIEQDLSTLAKIIAKEAGISTAAAAAGPPPIQYRVVKKTYSLTRLRSTLTVKATADPIAPPADTTKKSDGTTAGAKPSETKADSVTASATITTGPEEHFYLSTDLPVSKTSQLKYDDTTKQFVNKDTPVTFLAGVSYMIGDILPDSAPFVATPRSIIGRVVVKTLFKVSSHPLDSAGAGLGFRLPPFNTYGFQLDTFSPWIGYIWIKEDKPSGSHVGTRYSGHVQGGISFNLDKALSWIK
jgi:hypothetical protein